MAHYGLDYDDPAYTHRMANPYNGWCTVCHRHYEDRRNRKCDLEKARREEMLEMGWQVSTCFHCAEVYPTVIGRAALCPTCKVKQERRDAAAQRKNGGRGYAGLSTGVRVPDGLGCSEKLPAWMVDWDGNPNG